MSSDKKVLKVASHRVVGRKLGEVVELDPSDLRVQALIEGGHLVVEVKKEKKEDGEVLP